LAWEQHISGLLSETQLLFGISVGFVVPVRQKYVDPVTENQLHSKPNLYKSCTFILMVIVWLISDGIAKSPLRHDLEISHVRLGSSKYFDYLSYVLAIYFRVTTGGSIF